MANTNAKFWLDLLALAGDEDNRVWMWNGYLCWKLQLHTEEESVPQAGRPKLIIKAPDGGWPKLFQEEKDKISKLAHHHGGHPNFDQNYMDFSNNRFDGEINLSGLTFINSNFDGASFGGGEFSFIGARFFGKTNFIGAEFYGVDFDMASFNAPVSFESSTFEREASFGDVDFIGGASFKNVTFDCCAEFDNSKFIEDYFSDKFTIPILVNFSNTQFMAGASFRNTLFGDNDTNNSKRLAPERSVDFTNAKFKARTDFQGAVFGGAPAFFNTTLHEDTDFSSIDWKKAETDNTYAEYAIRAWERLELMMSKLEKPLERHQFFRLKMRARRRTDSWFLRSFNRLFEVTADYGWGVRRAFSWWFGHWFVSSLVLYFNAGIDVIKMDHWKLVKAALGTGFANAHAFLGLATGEGYLASCSQFMSKNNVLGFLTIIGTIEAFLGPIFLFLLLLTLRNRFRLA